MRTFIADLVGDLDTDNDGTNDTDVVTILNALDTKLTTIRQQQMVTQDYVDTVESSLATLIARAPAQGGGGSAYDDSSLRSFIAAKFGDLNTDDDGTYDTSIAALLAGIATSIADLDAGTTGRGATLGQIRNLFREYIGLVDSNGDSNPDVTFVQYLTALVGSVDTDGDGDQDTTIQTHPVSYTHLTLPTKA